MSRKIMRFEVVDPTGVVTDTRHISYLSGEGNRTAVSIGKYTHFFNNDGELMQTTLREEITNPYGWPINRTNI
jgi:hypothetical protein